MPNHPQVSSLQVSPVISSKLSHVVAHLSGEKEGAQLWLCGKIIPIKDEVIAREQVEKKILTQPSLDEYIMKTADDNIID